MAAVLRAQSAKRKVRKRMVLWTARSCDDRSASSQRNEDRSMRVALKWKDLCNIID